MERKLRELDDAMLKPAELLLEKLRTDDSRKNHFSTMVNMVSYGTKVQN